MTKKFYHALAVMALCLPAIVVPSQSQAAIGEIIVRTPLKYTVYTEDKTTKTGIVSVEASLKSISGNIPIPESVENGDITYSVTKVADFGFIECGGLTGMKLPNSITNIGNSAFAHSGLRNVIIPESITSIDDHAFEDCVSLGSVKIPSKVTSIGASAFYGCASLTNVFLEEGLADIGAFAFGNCTKLKSIEIPRSVTMIWYDAFIGCNNLTAAYFKGNAPTDDNAFFAPTVIYYRPGTKGWTNPWSRRPATLWIEAPQIEEQPKSQAVLEGDSVTFTVKAEGTAPLNYQWYKDDIAIEGATREKYTIESVVAENLGNYKVVVSNTEGEVVSDVAVLSLLQPPVITVNPVSVTVDNGTNVIFTVEAQNADSYQWYKDGTAISGATETTYSIDYVKGSDVGTYTVMVINRAGEEKSSPATLSLTQPYRATAELQIVNGFIVGISVTDCGWGYEFEPKVRIKDEFGEGAEAHCVVENGMIVGIVIDNPGSGYSEESTVKVGSPVRYNSMEIAVKDVLITMHLTFGEMYQVECSKDMKTWEKVGEPFIAEDETVEIVVDVIETGRYFRVHEVK